MFRIAYKKEEIGKLINLAQNGDIKALEELIRRIQKDIYSIFLHLTDKIDDVSDLTQETLIKMAKGLRGLKSPEHFRSWLNRIVTNTFYDYSRRHRHDPDELSEDMIRNLKDKLGCEPGEKCLFTEIEKIIRTALLSLPWDLRITIILREFEGLSYGEIAEITKVSQGTVKSRISRARTKLQQDLKEFI